MEPIKREIPVTRSLLLAALLSLSLGALAQEKDIVLTIKDHKFSPDRIEIAAGKKVKVIVENNDATPEEFESETLKIEKVIPGNSKATIYVGPLKAGEYKFVGEFNEKTAKGVIVAK
jgi:plastocyanin